MKKRRGSGVTAIKFKDKAGGSPRVSRKDNNKLDNHEDSGLEKLVDNKSIATISKKKSDALRCMRVCYPGDEIALSTSKGTIVRQCVDDLSIQSRTGTGVMIQKLSDDDTVVMVDIIPAAKAEKIIDM